MDDAGVTHAESAGAAGFGARLIDALDTRGPLCVGIDPHPQLLDAWGLRADAAGLARFAEVCVAAFADSVAVIKPQSGLFEPFGARGIEVLERTVAACREAGALVIVDAKRGDIGTTMAGYARAYLDPAAPLAADALTVSPYLGVGSLDPAFELSQRHGKGVFVIAVTSNPEAGQVQHAQAADGRTVSQVVIDDLAERNQGGTPLGSLGVVVGATIGTVPLELGKLNGPLLVPGIGAQGGTAGDVRRIFDPVLRAVLPSVSREVLRAGPEIAALRAAAARQAESFAFLRD